MKTLCMLHQYLGVHLYMNLEDVVGHDSIEFSIPYGFNTLCNDSSSADSLRHELNEGFDGDIKHRFDCSSGFSLSA